MEPSRPSSFSRRVLLRPPSSSSSTTPHFSPPFPSPSPLPPPIPPDPSPPRPPHPPPFSSFKSPSPPPPPSGVVVVGFIGLRQSDVSQILNRVIDSNVFGSGNRDKVLLAVGEEEGDEVKEWFRARRISYYHDDEKGIVYLQMCSTNCPVVDEKGIVSGSDCEFGSAVEELEFGDLKGMLLMFTVCHVIIYILEGSHFHIELLKKFRVLQSAKHALASSVKSRDKMPSLSGWSPSRTRMSSKSPPGRGGSFQNRQNSSISNMSSVGLYTSLFPGQCTPVTLFAFVDDFSEMMTSIASVEESKDASSSNQISALSNLGRSGFPVRGSGSVVVLARPVNKLEGGSRRKLQSSLEAQIRFLIKKSRTLWSSDISRAGSRNGTFFGSLPLLTLDASRAVVLIDSCTNKGGGALDFAAGLVEDVLNGKATPDSLLLETHGQNGNREDIGSLKEFIFKQADILRGKGGITSASSGSAAGVGMVAAAAAAAAASAAPRRLRSTPELPSLPIWLSSTQDILKGLMSAQHRSMDDIDIHGRKFRQRNGVPPPVDGATTKEVDPLDVAASLLEGGKGMNSKFSTSWCQRAFPAALEVYLKDLPAYYPTLQHETHLVKALLTFKSMVKGTSVKQFMKKLENECTSIWKSGRQSCDVVSLTGRSCVHPRHDIHDSSDANGRPHSSEFVFLHACACGRSRRPRADPFDFENANVTFNCFPDCDKLIPMMQLPKVSDSGCVELLAWHIVRVGDSGYYDPSKGLPQSGFSANQKFLMKWSFVIEKDIVPVANISYANAVKQGSFNTSPDTTFESRPDVNTRKDIPLRAHSEVQSRVEGQRSTLEQLKYDDRKISFGKGLPNITMKKPFSEVVAGSASTNSVFPPLQTKKHPSVVPEKGLKKISVKDGNTEQATAVYNGQRLDKAEVIASAGENLNDMSSNGKPFLQIGSNVVPLSVSDGGKTRPNLSLEQVLVYLGFEHECPCGHRFILSLDHLNGLGSSYCSAEETIMSSSVNKVDSKHKDPQKLAMNSSYDKLHLAQNDSTTATHKGRNLAKSGEEMHADGDLSMSGPLYLSKLRKEQHHASSDASLISDSFKDLHVGLKDLDDGEHACSLLNRDLPIYMNCPQCRISKSKKDKRNLKFAGTVSQLQRIFVVCFSFMIAYTFLLFWYMLFSFVVFSLFGCWLALKFFFFFFFFFASLTCLSEIQFKLHSAYCFCSMSS
ncbi:hypothetical protein Dimus_039112 [Dionaea muscipula]